MFEIEQILCHGLNSLIENATRDIFLQFPLTPRSTNIRQTEFRDNVLQICALQLTING